MNLREVAFISSQRTLSSVQIRCLDIATRLGCNRILNVQRESDIPKSYRVLICVKLCISSSDLGQLAQRSAIIWDLIDRRPPARHVMIYLTSTHLGKKMCDSLGRSICIPHHHCNFERNFGHPLNRHPGWIGARQWCPPDLPWDKFFVEGKNRQQIAENYRSIGLGLNVRHSGPGFRRHLALNSGIKLINCIGFGLPSVSHPEPAYREIGPQCTSFANTSNLADAIDHLQHDEAAYQRMRSHCLSLAEQFHIDHISQQYKQLLAQL